MSSSQIIIPWGKLGVSADDKAAEEQRKRIAEMLRNGEAVSINQAGVLHAPGEEIPASPGMSGPGQVVQGDVELVVPTGKLAVL